MGDRDKTARKRKPGSETDNDLENQAKDDKKNQLPVQRSARLLVGQILLAVFIVLALYLMIVPSPIDPISVFVTYLPNRYFEEHLWRDASGSTRKSEPLPYFDGVLEPNTKLQQITKIGVGKLPGPESIQVDRDGNIYTGLHDGRIVKITKSGEIIEVARTGEYLPNCGETEVEEKCGRPLGLQFDKNEENLIICDGYLGLLKLHIATSKLTTLISASEGVQDTPFKFVNHLAISSNNIVYFTDSSWKWSRKDFPYLILEGGGQGRLISYDLITGESETLLHGLFFANGIALSPDEDFILISETTQARIMRYFIKGSRKGVYDLFHDNLPGLPDNIRPSRNGGYWVALPSIRKWPFSFLDTVGPYPTLKSIIAKIMPKHIFQGLVKKYGLLIKLDYYGDIIESYHDPDGTVITHISEVYEHNDVLYLGSFKNNFLGKLRLNK